MNDSPEQTAEAESHPPAATPDAGPSGATPPPAEQAEQAEQADLDRIEADLAGVESALERLDAGTYWSDEVTGDPLPDELLIADPVARRAP
ncbi:MAG TPA: hypothetical protein VIS05_04505 [Ilumatobacter sp.]